jgi:hypothetical protein
MADDMEKNRQQGGQTGQQGHSGNQPGQQGQRNQPGQQGQHGEQDNPQKKGGQNQGDDEEDNLNRQRRAS